MSKTKLKLIVPIYKTELSDLEHISMHRAYTVLSAYDIVAVHPQSLDISALQNRYPILQSEAFADHFFESTSSYNALMLSKEFYARFLDQDYILIYQLDAYVFEDSLFDFVHQGYDYVGAPWPVKWLYRRWGISHFMRWRQSVHNKRGNICRQDLYNKVGNGGLSLRKVQSFYQACEDYKERIDYYLSRSSEPLYNEDVFWATEPHHFRYPTVAMARKFSFDKYPRQCLAENGGELPMGCHGWYKWKWRDFWKGFISETV